MTKKSKTGAPIMNFLAHVSDNFAKIITKYAGETPIPSYILDSDHYCLHNLLLISVTNGYHVLLTMYSALGHLVQNPDSPKMD